jgi:hypothetical protein
MQNNDDVDNDNFNGAYAAYKRLVRLADTDNAGPVRRVARDLTFIARESIIGIAAADLQRHPDDFAIEMVMHVCMDENRG